MDNESNILDDINNLIQFATEHPPIVDETERQHEISAAVPTFRKMDEDILVLEW